MKKMERKKREMSMGILFAGTIILLVAIAYLDITKKGMTAKVFGGGVLVLYGLFLFIILQLKKK